MDGFGGLIAIIMACQVHSGPTTYEYANKRQLQCQKELIACYEKKKEARSFKIEAFSDSQDSMLSAWAKWEGDLKDCIKERKIK